MKFLLAKSIYKFYNKQPLFICTIREKHALTYETILYHNLEYYDFNSTDAKKHYKILLRHFATTSTTNTH